jgi:hypothetical protein
MGMFDFLKGEYRKIESHVKYDLYKWGTFTAGGTLIAVGAWLVHKISWLPDWAAYAAAFVLALFAFIWFSGRFAPVQALGKTERQTQRATPDTGKFQNVDEFYKTYDNALLLETEDNVRKLSDQYQPGPDRERFFVRFVASGIFVVFFEITFLNIFGSQIRALEGLNKGMLKLDGLRPYYDEAAAKNPEYYSRRSFESWLSYLRDQILIRTQGDNVEIAPRGREFLKYLIQCGRSASDRAL